MVPGEESGCSLLCPGRALTSGSEPQRQQESTSQQNQPWEGSGPGLWGQPSKDLSRHLAGDKLLPQAKEPNLLQTGKSEESTWTKISEGSPDIHQAGKRHGSSQLPREQHVLFLPRSPWKMPQRPPL